MTNEFTKKEIEKENENLLSEEKKEEEEFIKEDSSNSTVEKSGGFFKTPDGKFAKVLLIATMVLFTISMVSPYLWYFAAGASIIFPITFLIVGAFTLKKGGGNLMGFAVLFFVVALVVGTGTCFINMYGM